MSQLLRAASRLGIALVLASASAAPAAEAGGVAALQPALLDATVNGQRSAEPSLFLQGPDGELYASAEALRGWRLRLPATGSVTYEGEAYYRISGLPLLRIAVADAEQAVAIEADPAAFEARNVSLASAPDAPMTRPSTGVFLNYDIFAEHVGDDDSVSGGLDFGLFTARGVVETSLIANAGAGPDRVVRLESAWSIDWPGNATSLRVGDSISSVGPGGTAVRFGGVQYFRNYAVQPGFITMPLPSGAGSAAVPSIVDIYVNNALQSSQEVAPGPFQLDNIPVQSGGGNVQIVVRDLLGRETVSEQSYYASTLMLRAGLHDFSWQAGFLRRDFGRRSNAYEEFMASTTHRVGLTDQVTAEGHVEASEEVQMAGAAATVQAGAVGQVGASASVSHSDRRAGYRIAASFERNVPGLSFGARAEYSDADYAFIGMSARRAPPRYTIQAYADLPLPRGSIGANLLHRSLRGAEPDETLAGLFGSYQISGSASVQLSLRHVVASKSNTIVGAHLALALGGRRSASVSVEHDGDQAIGYASFQDNPPPGIGDGYWVAANVGRIDSVEASYLRHLPMATLGAQAAHADGRTGLRLSAAGAVGYLGGDAFASRALGESFAQVRVEGYSGVRVYADDQLIGTTGPGGTLIVPGLRPYDTNRLRLEYADLPIDAQVEVEEQVVRPYARSGSTVRFAVRRERGVLMRIRLEDGSDLPAGATLQVEGKEESFVAARGGEAYLRDFAGRVVVRAAWQGGSCRFTATIPEGGDPQPRIDGLICRRDAVYAAQ